MYLQAMQAWEIGHSFDCSSNLLRLYAGAARCTAADRAPAESEFQ